MGAHCETATLSSLFQHYGYSISESMILGLTGGIFFAYIDSQKFAFPTIVTRSKPGDIRKKIFKRVNADYELQRFKNPDMAMDTLDNLLANHIPVAVQVDMFCMEYIPQHMRAHFNGHFIIVIGKEAGSYLVSDTTFPAIATISESALIKGRFAKGDLAPKGLMLHLKNIDKNPPLEKFIIKGIKDAIFYMIKLPVPFIGVKGIRKFAKKIMEWPKIARDDEHLSHEIMSINIILEERGTGGAGFRFMYASFLQEASNLLKNEDLSLMSKNMLEIGDNWRDISLFSARIGKTHDFGTEQLKKLQKMILKQADDEEIFFKQLSKVIK